MNEIQVKIEPVDLPHGPRDTMARLRGDGRHALLESALSMPGQAEWSYVAGPARATLYTDARGTRLERDGRVEARWNDPFDAIEAMSFRGLPNGDDRPDGLGFV